MLNAIKKSNGIELLFLEARMIALDMKGPMKETWSYSNEEGEKEELFAARGEL